MENRRLWGSLPKNFCHRAFCLIMAWLSNVERTSARCRQHLQYRDILADPAMWTSYRGDTPRPDSIPALGIMSIDMGQGEPRDRDWTVWLDRVSRWRDELFLTY